MAPGPSQILGYVDRALSDDHLLDQLRELVSDTRRSQSRARRRGVGDQQAQRSALSALGALTAFARRAPQPEPPPRHRLRHALLLAGVGVVAVTAVRGAGSSGGEPGSPA